MSSGDETTRIFKPKEAHSFANREMNHFRSFLFAWFTTTAFAQVACNLTAEDDLGIDSSTSLVLCLADIIRNIKRDTRKVSVFGDAEIVGDVLANVDIPVMANSPESPRSEGLEKRIRNDLVIVIVGANLTASEHLRSVLWHGDTIFLLAFDGNDTSVDNAFRGFWKEKVANVFAIASDDDGSVSLYGFVPFAGRNCSAADPILLDRWSRNGGFLRGDGLRRMRETIRFTDLNGCPVNVTVVDVKPQVFFHDDCSCNGSRNIGGIEGRVMHEIAKRFNMNVSYVIALDGIGWGWIKPEPHGVVGEVYTGRSDFGLGLLAPTIERYENLDISVRYNGLECITYGLPKGAGAKQPTWITILVFEFEATTWILIILALVLVSAWFTLANRTLRFPLLPRNLHLVVYLLGLCLGNPVKIQSSVTLRTAFTSWILFTFVITVAYKSSMGSRLTVPTPDPDIDTFKQLLQSDLQLTGYNNMLRLMEYDDGDADIKLMTDRFVVTNFDIDYAVDAIAHHQRIAHVRHRTTFLYYSLINPKAKGHIHLVRDCIYQYYPLFVMRKNSPFERRTNSIITRLNEAGIVNYWTSEYIYELPKKPNTFVKLSLGHTFGMFFIMLFGYVLAFGVFVGELVRRSFTRPERLRNFKFPK